MSTDSRAILSPNEGQGGKQREADAKIHALIPGNTGTCNPSMTIAAVVERAMDEIVQSDVGSVI